jgi:propanediol dehydratase large subunit
MKSEWRINMPELKRAQIMREKPVNKDVLADPLPEIGFSTDWAPSDPEPSIRIENGLIVEMDGKERGAFDSLDYFIADYGIDRSVCEEAMGIPAEIFARMLVDINIPRGEILRLAAGLTPSSLTRIVSLLNIVEIMMAQMKMRARGGTANQAHVTNLRDNPVLLAADAAEAALRGFAELETTCVVGRCAPLSAIAILVGSQVGRPGVMTQCSMEEAFELQLGIQGLTSYAETVSVYGTENVFTDGDDTPWSKAFLSSAYASRGIKMRSSSGSGAEVLMGGAEGKSMLYLETRCIWITKAAGIQGTQNGSIDGIALSSSLPGGLRMIAAENLIASILGLEVAAGNDTWFTASDMRRTAKLIPQLFAGTDFITSGYGATPNSDSVFAGSNEDTDDYDDYYTMQRDYLIDGGLSPALEKDVIRVRREAGKALQAVFAEFGFSAVGDAEIEAAVSAYESADMPARNMQNDLSCAEVVMNNRITGIDIALALRKRGFKDTANALLALLKQRVAGDYLQTAAIFNERFEVLSAINDSNDYRGPRQGGRLSRERIDEISRCRRITEPAEIIAGAADVDKEDQIVIHALGPAKFGIRKDEVVIAVSPSFGVEQKKTLGNVSHLHVLDEIASGLEEEGIRGRFVKSYETSDLGAMAAIASGLSGSGIGIAVQSKGTSVIHQKDLSPLFNLELFSQAPQLDRKLYRAIGKSAGKYAKGELPKPIPAIIDPEVRRYLVSSAILHYNDTNCVVRQKPPVEFEYAAANADETKWRQK